MLPLVTYELIRQRDEERRARSLQRFWWRYRQGGEDPLDLTGGADVIEVAFGARCDREEPVGA
jgi:hypothetical protein